MNTHFQCAVFDELLGEGRVWPVAPLWTHFQHTLFPRRYEDWIAYDQALLPLYHACLRLEAVCERTGYRENESAGADAEVETFKKLGRPVFYSKIDLYHWVDRGCP